MNMETLNIKTATEETKAYVARPNEKASAVILLIQEYWGINDHIRDIAGRYAKEGYLCVAPDLYRGKIAANAQEASKLMQSLQMKDGLEIIRKTIEETERAYGAHKIGITGYCMGGTYALRTACEDGQLSAAAPFYGDIPPENVLKNLRVPTLFIAANHDAWINPEKVDTLRQAAQKHNLPVEIVAYDADHAFFNDTRPQVYDAAAASDAWKRVLALFSKYLGQTAVRSA
ncbi:MAG TPA: dienelactone hydrolase family protein [Pyrinomonadaceae bacterium]